MKGSLFLVVGNSGSGKDAIIKWAIDKCSKVNIVRRVITRPESKDTEDFISITKDAFNKDDYFLYWESYDKLYGVGKDVLNGLVQNKNYIVNISRDVIDYARTKWINSFVVEVSAPIELIKERLQSRKRESSIEIKKRLERAKNAPKINADIVIDASNSDVSIAGKKLLDFINTKI